MAACKILEFTTYVLGVACPGCAGSAWVSGLCRKVPRQVCSFGVGTPVLYRSQGDLARFFDYIRGAGPSHRIRKAKAGLGFEMS